MSKNQKMNLDDCVIDLSRKRQQDLNDMEAELRGWKRILTRTPDAAEVIIRETVSKAPRSLNAMDRAAMASRLRNGSAVPQDFAHNRIP
jgi:hypothetical protein